jgi:glycosyltransferase involved in cell wall biosynthesis
MRPLNASVVLCTYQGERFLPEQLASLHAQSRSAFEILAQDDASTDSTPALLRADSRVTVHINHQRLGFAANFSSALAKASGDVIFLADHDDIWESDKLEVMLRHFEKDPQLQMACSEASLIDAESRPLAGAVLGPNGLTSEERRRWSKGNALPFLLRRNAVPGMTTAFRVGFLDKILPVPEGWEHDYWLLTVAAARNLPILVEEKPLVRYRQHASQEIGGKKGFMARLRQVKSLEQRTQEALRWGALIPFALPHNRPLIEGKRAHLQRRGAFPRSRLPRACAIAGELWRGDYSLFDAGLSSAVKDLLS